MPSTAKYFSERLNECLDEIGAPISMRERATILSKILGLPKQQAWALIEGQQSPSPMLLQQIASEFEVDPQWLTGSHAES